MLLSNWIAGFFDYQDLQKKLIDLLDILHESTNQKLIPFVECCRPCLVIPKFLETS